MGTAEKVVSKLLKKNGKPNKTFINNGTSTHYDTICANRAQNKGYSIPLKGFKALRA